MYRKWILIDHRKRKDVTLTEITDRIRNDRPQETERGRYENWRRNDERQYQQDDTLYREYSNEFEQQNRYQNSYGHFDGNNRNFEQQNYQNDNAEVCVGYDDGIPRPENDFDRKNPGNHRPEMHCDRPRGEGGRNRRKRGRGGRNESYHPRPETDFNTGVKQEEEMMVLDEFRQEEQVEDTRPVTVTNDKPAEAFLATLPKPDKLSAKDRIFSSIKRKI